MLYGLAVARRCEGEQCWASRSKAEPTRRAEKGIEFEPLHRSIWGETDTTTERHLMHAIRGPHGLKGKRPVLGVTVD